MASSIETAAQFLDELKEIVIKAFMTAPQIDGHHGARVPVDFTTASKSTRRKVMRQQDDGNYWATVPQLPVPTSCA
uniref:Uncharacterized protein n=1 Tax=Globisporangium ultimum (strain ATCC 200006 / CBS 805.95 / DAOM BR144) TaxID=431595 RepID=K3WH25_GLOUD